MYALIDCNNFYASCERVFRPDLVGKPVAVLSNNDGCVIARSNEVKALGIPMGAPAFKFQEVFEKHNVHVFSANFPLYGDMSKRVMNIIKDHCPQVEVYSIDEAFLHFEKFDHYDMDSYLSDLYSAVVRSTGISISIGLAANKVLSKVANRIAKKYMDKTGGVYSIDTDEKRIKALKWLKVGDIWGIGRRLSKRLNEKGVITAYDFIHLDEKWVQKNMSVVEMRIRRELLGESVLSIEKRKPKKNIATTRTFEKTYSTFEEIKERVATFASSCSEKLRKEKSCCQSVMVFVHTNSYRKNDKQYNRNIVVKLPYPTNSSIEIAKFAVKGLQKIFRQGYRYKKAGVVVMDICPQSAIQKKLFENSNPKHSQALKVIDKLHDKLGGHKIKLASQDTGRVWKMKQERLSPKYSTQLSDIITVHV